MRYILEIVVQKRDETWECVDTIEADTPIPIPSIGDDVLTPNGWLARVINRQFWFTFINRVPLVKVEIQCRRSQEERAEGEVPPERRGGNRK
jgi:hypothetical protein